MKETFYDLQRGVMDMKRWFKQWNYTLISLLLGSAAISYFAIVGIIHTVKSFI
jgi:hypothetical protein